MVQKQSKYPNITKEIQSLTKKKIRITHWAMRIYLSIPFGSYLYLLNLLEMQTVIKQAICVNVLQMCCKYGNKQR